VPRLSRAAGAGAPLLPLAELWSVGASYKSAPIAEVLWHNALTLNRATLPLALTAPGLLMQLQPQAPGVFPHAFAPTLGVMGGMLAALGLFARALDRTDWLLLLVGVGFALAPPGLGWPHDVPLLRSIMPQYFWPLILLPLTQGAARALPLLATTPGRRATNLLLLGVVLLLVWLRWLTPEAYAGPHLAPGLAAALERPAGFFWCWVPPALAILALLLVRRRPHLSPLLGALATLDLLVVFSTSIIQPGARALRSPPSPAIRFLQRALDAKEGRFVGVPDNVAFPNRALLVSLPDLRAVSAIPVRRFAEYINAIDPGPRFPTFQTASFYRSILFDRAAVRWVISYRRNPRRAPVGSPVEGLRLEYFDDEVEIYRNQLSLPRVRISHAAQPVANAAVALDRLRRWSRQPPRNHPTLVEASAGTLRLESPSSPGLEAASVREEAPERLEIEARLDAPGLLIIADTYYPGWRATVDGQGAPIYPADLLFRAIPLPAGLHKVVLTYQPRALWLGLLLALGALLEGLLLSRSRRWA